MPVALKRRRGLAAPRLPGPCRASPRSAGLAKVIVSLPAPQQHALLHQARLTALDARCVRCGGTAWLVPQGHRSVWGHLPVSPCSPQCSKRCVQCPPAPLGQPRCVRGPGDPHARRRGRAGLDGAQIVLTAGVKRRMRRRAAQRPSPPIGRSLLCWREWGTLLSLPLHPPSNRAPRPRPSPSAHRHRPRPARPASQPPPLPPPVTHLRRTCRRWRHGPPLCKTCSSCSTT